MSEIAEPHQDEIDAFWTNARMRADLNGLQAYWGPTPLDALLPTISAFGATAEEADDEEAVLGEPARAQQGDEGLAVRERVELRVATPRALGPIGGQIGEEPVHGLGTHEVAPLARPRATHEGQPLVER
jgi:hypothetical protein